MRAITLSDNEIERRAQKRAGARLGWLVHASVYLLVNVLLFAVSAASGKHWAVYPFLGWGLGLMIHGLVVWMVMPGSGLYQRLLQQERARLQPQRDPW